MRSARDILLGSIVTYTTATLAQEGQNVPWDQPGFNNNVEGALLGVSMWMVFFGLCAWFVLLFRKDWSRTNSQTRILGKFEAGSLQVSTSAVNAPKFEMIPNRSWRELLMFVCIIAASVYLLNGLFADFMRPFPTDWLSTH